MVRSSRIINAAASLLSSLPAHDNALRRYLHFARTAHAKIYTYPACGGPDTFSTIIYITRHGRLISHSNDSVIPLGRERLLTCCLFVGLLAYTIHFEITRSRITIAAILFSLLIYLSLSTCALQSWRRCSHTPAALCSTFCPILALSFQHFRLHLL